jgi:murein DD-endopeptidase MepM/ murein hydrolase activator NlpD
MNKFGKIITAILLVLALNTAVLAAPAPTIQQKQQAASRQVQKLKALEKAEKSKLVQNQHKLESASTNLAVSQAKYNSINNQLSVLERDYSSAMASYNVANAHVQERIRKVFKQQRVGMFRLILSAQDLNSLLDVVYFQKLILKRDTENLMRIKVQSQSIAQMKYDIESRKSNLAQSISTINSQKKNISKAIAQNQNMINKLKTDRAYYEKTERELARQSADIQHMISKNKGETVVASSGGSFGRPIGGPITSPFGWRTHPIFNSRTFHSGVDIGGPNLGSIRASNAGKVIFSGWYGGYGKVVIIDHGVVNGSPITTLYAHMNTIKVSDGQYVNKGDVIGLEGTTGYSTGPHCHFEVRVNGSPNNPLNYI